MTSIEMKKELSEEFLSDILITAFDGAYGACWQWFEPITGTDKFWLKTKNDTGADSESNPWLSAKVRLSDECLTGEPLFDTREGWEIDHAVLAVGISRILNDDYIGVWREPTERELEDILGGNHYSRVFKKDDQGAILVETGETARGVKAILLQAVTELEAGDIDAIVADCIVQVGVFGKCIFG